MEAKPTSALDVALPVEIVRLLHLKTKGGDPVEVRCEAVEEVAMARLLRALPGARPKEVANGDDPLADDEDERLRRAAQFDEYAPGIIEAGTSFSDARPAFYYGAEPPHPLSLPGRLLRLEDRVLLVTSIMRLSGYLGGAAASGAQFHDGVGSGAGGRLGVVETGPLHGTTPVFSDGTTVVVP